MTDRDLMQQALDALENSVDTVRHDYETDWRHKMPTRKAQLEGMKAGLDAHDAAIAALQERLAHCDRCGKRLGGEGDIHTCTPPAAQQAGGEVDEKSTKTQCLQGLEAGGEAPAQPEQEPVAWMVYTQDGKSVYVTDNPTDIQEGQRALPLYTTPPAAQHQAAERNKLAAWMIAQGYATGHGDTMEGLLEELRWQVSESEREACADIAENWNCNGSPRLGVAAQIRARGHSMDRREEYEQGRQAS